MKLERLDLSVDELDDDIWLAVEGERYCWHGAASSELLPPADVRALLDPCATCGGVGRRWIDGRWLAPHSPATNSTLHIESCPDCIDGRRKFDIVVPCPTCKEWFHHGTPLGKRDPTCGGTGFVSRTYTVADDPALLPVRGTGDVIDEWGHMGWTECIAVDHLNVAYHVTGIDQTTVVNLAANPGTAKRPTHAVHLRAVTA